MFRKLLSVLLLLTVGLAGPMGIAAEAMPVGHGLHGNHHAGGGAGAGIDTSLWERSATVACRHCAALDCVGVVHCGNVTIAVGARFRGALAVAPLWLSSVPSLQRALSLPSRQPPTPPPQLIA